MFGGELSVALARKTEGLLTEFLEVDCALENFFLLVLGSLEVLILLLVVQGLASGNRCCLKLCKGEIFWIVESSLIS